MVLFHNTPLMYGYFSITSYHSPDVSIYTYVQKIKVNFEYLFTSSKIVSLIFNVNFTFMTIGSLWLSQVSSSACTCFSHLCSPLCLTPEKENTFSFGQIIQFADQKVLITEKYLLLYILCGTK